MSVPPRKVYKRRETITELPLYFSGHLQKKTSKERDFKKFYAELRGSTLFLYKDDTQDTYMERMDLEQLKSKELDHPYKNKTLSLSLPTEQVQIKKEVPSTLNLLPGQRLQLEDVLAREKKRTERPALPPRPTFLHSNSPSSPPKKDEPDHAATEMPDCFFDVSRQEAEKMLREHPECGSIILRPSALAHNYALTLRQQNPSGDTVKNFRVTSTNAGFVIELDAPVTVSSMNDVVNYFLEKTEYRLQPYRASQPYDTRFEVSPTPKYISITPSAPKQVPKAQVAPMQRSETKVDPPPAAVPEEGDYVLPDDGKSAKFNQRPSKKNVFYLRSCCRILYQSVYPVFLSSLSKWVTFFFLFILANLEGELRAVLKLRREAIYGGKEGETNKNQGASKSESGTATWSKNSSVA
ncbi:signal-transducing adaptor protein 1-like isoform X2 [Cheilinus undulatus]|uniref:signal-transducing adaptor protein 1-like isoform X2 n=1 Tax=Cheilinus undulatus TaxID=241271 RepID=UPI001BD54703|nr:signal-transducing adaptor protein 1-like isoform X2 [Cheilinus undulatus]